MRSFHKANGFLWEIFQKDEPLADSIAKGNPQEADFTNMCLGYQAAANLLTQVDFPLGRGAFTEVWGPVLLQLYHKPMGADLLCLYGKFDLPLCWATKLDFLK